MSFFGLFGNKKKKSAVSAVTGCDETIVTESIAIDPSVIVAIGAAVDAVMNDDVELIAAVTAAIMHAQGGARAVRFSHSSNVWTIAGRQKIMNGRNFA